MSNRVKVCRGSWCMAFGLEPMATLDQVVRVLSAFGYDGIELGGLHDHATLERYPDKASRKRLASELEAAGLEPTVIAPGPTTGGSRGLSWSVAGGEVLDRYKRQFGAFLELSADVGIPAMRIDPGVGPLPYDADYDRVWATVVEAFRDHAEQGQEVGCTMLWELETRQPFNKPSEVVKLLEDVDHPNFKLLYDTSHFHQVTTVGHNQVQPVERLEGGQVELVRRLEGQIGHVHLCDTTGDIAQNYFGTKLGIGKGIVDFDELVPALLGAYDGEWWGVDSMPMSSEAWADTYDDVGTVRELVGA